jgi:5-formyltetrahydrofolate cyclo-ligase
MQAKADIRKLVLQKRNDQMQEEIISKSEAICNQLIELDEYKYAKVIYIYMDFKNEVKTKPIIDNALKMGKKIALPKIENNVMSFYYIHSYEYLKKGYFGILEPNTTELAEDRKALIVVPGVAFDERGFRVGYGKGFYDRFLSQHMVFTKVALAFKLQIVDQIPNDEHDVAMDMIITEERIINII